VSHGVPHCVPLTVPPGCGSATLVAATLVARGLRVFLLRGTERDRYAPTPLLAFAVASLHCAAGVMVTASHNPKQYNGYKVYWGNGCQIIPPVDQGIAAAIEANLTPWERPASVVDHPLVSNPMATVSGALSSMRRNACLVHSCVDASYASMLHCCIVVHKPDASMCRTQLSEQYLVAVGGLRRRERAANAAAPPLVYTPLHGVGLPLLRRAFHTFGLPPPLVVAAQVRPCHERRTCGCESIGRIGIRMSSRGRSFRDAPPYPWRA
jgi:phosphomannomutase